MTELGWEEHLPKTADKAMAKNNVHWGMSSNKPKKGYNFINHKHLYTIVAPDSNSGQEETARPLCWKAGNRLDRLDVAGGPNNSDLFRLFSSPRKTNHLETTKTPRRCADSAKMARILPLGHPPKSPGVQMIH